MTPEALTGPVSDLLEENGFDDVAKLLRGIASRMHGDQSFEDTLNGIVMMLNRQPRTGLRETYVTLDHEGNPRIERDSRVRRLKFPRLPVGAGYSVRDLAPIHYEEEIVNAMNSRRFDEIQAELRRYGWKIAPIEEPRKEPA